MRWAFVINRLAASPVASGAGVLVGQEKAARSRLAMSLFPLPTSPNAQNEAIANAVGIFVVAGKAFAQDSLLNENPQRQRAEDQTK